MLLDQDVSKGTLRRPEQGAVWHEPGVYRADIDGLRAIAVLIVLLFHTGISPLRGGFIGVDVFFVISGYLITKAIWHELQQGTFSLLTFYERRTRRILPALVFAVAVTLVCAPLVLFASERATTVWTGLAALTSVSNLYLAVETLGKSGYFAADVYSQPLVHTWSLGVEEQFYLVFPFILLAVSGWGRWCAGAAVAATAFASFLFGLWLTGANRDLAYYVPVSRAWELIAGGLLVFLPLPRLPARIRDGLALLALALILGSAYRFHGGMFFPGVFAVAPVAGAVVLIAIGSTGGSHVTRFLALPPFVGIGKISYSLYLWHWPIFVGVALTTARAPTIPEAIGLLLASVAAAYLSWRFVEQPFRQRRIGRTAGSLWRLAGAAWCLCCLLGLGIWHFAAALPQTESDRLATYLTYDDRDVYRRGTCFLIGYQQTVADFAAADCLSPSRVKPNVLIMGDSHAAHLRSGFETALPQAHVMLSASSGCKPLIGVGGDPECVGLMRMMFQRFLPENRPDVLILSARWADEDLPLVAETLRQLKDKAGTVVVSGPIVEYQRPLARLLAQLAGGRSDALLVESRTTEQVQRDRDLQAVVETAGAIYVSPYRLLCPNPDTACRTTVGDVPLQWDYGHLTAEGSKVLAEAIIGTGAIPGARTWQVKAP
ncbi:acyltransferase family protein [Rhizobium sp. 9140]|uniref:acyltransferase family protein n=1 Tax=Rhizobium sp. 9140 TaxID=1761900 RepID=UPI00079B9BAB|nr:acyltransferase family protein [Rhizobium sp. 9140]CZT34677.1 Peptidoglycan/LPS O-acetylase OafA/YrhL, contains acyltransferase and SGNH-hydrolase domains [Rhizobium sp. 9140]